MNVIREENGGMWNLSVAWRGVMWLEGKGGDKK